jgi:hypothetical protein
MLPQTDFRLLLFSIFLFLRIRIEECWVPGQGGGDEEGGGDGWLGGESARLTLLALLTLLHPARATDGAG